MSTEIGCSTNCPTELLWPNYLCKYTAAEHRLKRRPSSVDPHEVALQYPRSVPRFLVRGARGRLVSEGGRTRLARSDAVLYIRQTRPHANVS